MKKEVAALDLSTDIPVEPFINIDGKPYDLKTHPDTTSALKQRDLAEQVRDLVQLRGEDRSAEDDTRIDELNHKLMAEYIDAPAEVLAKLPASEQQKVMKFVTAEIKNRTDPTQPGGDSAPGSTDSTESETG